MPDSVQWLSQSDYSAAYLSEALKLNKTLTDLVVSWNNIGDSGVAYLSKALRLNRTLTDLSKSKDNIGESGVWHLIGVTSQHNVHSFSKKVFPESEER